jgi:hypothetical protein
VRPDDGFYRVCAVIALIMLFFIWAEVGGLKTELHRALTDYCVKYPVRCVTETK